MTITNDDFDLETSHVLPAMLRKFHLAKLAAQGDWEAIRCDEERVGPIPKDIRSAMKGEGDASRSPVVRLWGTGAPRREFLHVDDMAAACVFVMQLSEEAYAAACRQPDGAQVSHLNIGCGEDASIRELSELVQAVVGFEGKVMWDSGKPDGMPCKLLDVSRLNRLSWRPQIGLNQGIRSVSQI